MLSTLWDAAMRGDFMYAALAIFALAMGWLAFSDARKARAQSPAKHDKTKIISPELVPDERPSVDLADLNGPVDKDHADGATA